MDSAEIPGAGESFRVQRNRTGLLTRHILGCGRGSEFPKPSASRTGWRPCVWWLESSGVPALDFDDALGIYSARNVCMGSTVAAFHAGRALAMAPIARRRAAALTYATGSVPLIS